MRTSRLLSLPSVLVLLGCVVHARLTRADPLPPQNSESRSLMAKVGLVAADTTDDGVAVAADLFTGTATRSIKLELPPGRAGVSPALALTYRSDCGNGWIGQGWELELGAVERNRRRGMSYAADDYVLRIGSSSVELVSVGGGDYRALIESDFKRVRKLTAADGLAYWEVTDRSGLRYRFGQTPATRQDNPGDATRIFRWSLDRVEDPNGNYYTVTYAKDQGAIYPDVLSYTGNGSLAPSTTVRFWRDAGLRPDASTSYAFHFGVKTAYRLQSVEVRTNGVMDRVFALEYGSSESTARSRLTAVRRIGADGTVNAIGIAAGSALPAETLGYSAGTPPTNVSIAGPAVFAMASITNVINSDLSRLRFADFNGDGRTDVAYVDGTNAYAPIKIFISNGSSFNAAINGPVRWIRSGASAVLNDVARLKLGDFNGDGRTDILAIDGTSGSSQVKVYLANADGSFPAQPSFYGPYVLVGAVDVDVSRVMLGDFSGDGRTDLLYVSSTTTSVQALKVYLSTGSGFGPSIPGPFLSVSSVSSLARLKLGDFNGDGSTDIAVVNGSGQSLPMTIYSLNATHTGVVLLMNGPTRSVGSTDALGRIDAMRVMAADINGDGKTDLLALEGWGTTAPISIYIATGTGFAAPFQGPSRYFDNLRPDVSLNRPRLGDFNGDGRVDLAFVEGVAGSFAMSIYLSEGSRFGTALAGPIRPVSGGTAVAYELSRVAVGDFDGDGRTDLIANNSSGGTTAMSVYFAQGRYPDLLASVSNGIGGTTTIGYLPSTAYQNSQLPIPRQTVSSTTTADGNGVAATTTYGYSGGYFHIAEREFRGFNRVDVTAPAGPDGEQRQTRYWFHQGNDVGIDANTPGDAVGFMKGKPYRVQVWDLQRSTYLQTESTYSPPLTAAPYFAPAYETRAQWCEQPPSQAVTCGRSTRTTFAQYDAYGNVTRERQYGDEADASDDRTIVRTYSPNTTAWIIGLPATEDVYAGIDPAMVLGNQIAGTSYFYDGALTPATCASTGASATPARGNVTKVRKLLKGSTDSEDWTGYDQYGNVVCARDADLRVTSFTYDSLKTFRTSTTNAKGHVTLTQYYGVDGIDLNAGRYGQPKKVMNPNRVETSFEYDTFGRKTKETNPPVAAPVAGDPYPGFSTTTTYYLGGVGANRVETLTSAGQWTAHYFDGLGRTYLTQKKGSPSASARVIATGTGFNPTGTILRTSLPYDYSNGTPRWRKFTYDGQGRAIVTIEPDGARELACYRDVDGSSSVIDANGHRRRQVKDVDGNLVSVQEYRGHFLACITDEGTPYATARYAYDRMGRVTTIVDAAGTQSVTDYDTLGRRTFVSDPDLGTWYFGYTAAGDVQWLQDANGTGLAPFKTWFHYDELHRVTRREYPSGLADAFGYDDSAVPYSLGQRTSMTDSSGSTAYSYDCVGRPWRTVRTIGSASYATTTGYDDAGRVAKETYPDAGATQASYQYDADGFLWKVTVGGIERATLTGFNSLGQIGTIAFGNGVTTQYVYNDAGNNRLSTITTRSVTGTLMSLTYGYDSAGNILSLTDGIDSSYSQTFGYDELNRLTLASSAALGALSYTYAPNGNITSKEGTTYAYDPVKVHAVKATSDGRTYVYDANGNLRSDGVRTLQYDFANRPVSVFSGGLQVLFAYDGDGQRVTKQVVPGATTTFVNRLYECTGGICTKHVFAGERRIALLRSDGLVRYHHPDHLDSTRAVTDGSGALVERMAYRPFGESGTATTKYGFTGKELDAETGLHFYGARYYDAALGRFISPDSAPPHFADPQTLNRYSYVKNNPVFYVDPSGYTEKPANDPRIWPAMVKADPALAQRILDSNNYSPFQFEQQLKNGQLLSLRSAATIRGLAGEQVVADAIANRGFLVFNPQRLFPERVAGRAFLPDVAWLQIRPPGLSVVHQVVLDRNGSIDDKVVGVHYRPGFFLGLTEVKSGHQFDASKPFDNGVFQANVNSLALRFVKPPGSAAAAVLVLDQSAWENSTAVGRAKTFDLLLKDTYIYPMPDLADRADARARAMGESVGNDLGMAVQPQGDP